MIPDFAGMTIRSPWSFQMFDPLSSLVKMISSLLIVLALILLIAYLVRRFLNSRLSRWRSAPVIQLLSTTYLGAKRQISVIEVGQEYLVVGVTPHQISLITKLEQSPFPLEPRAKNEETLSP